MTSSDPDEFDLAAARLVRETRDLRDEARALGHEKVAWLLGQAFNKLFWTCAAVIASRDTDGDPSETDDGEPGRHGAP